MLLDNDENKTVRLLGLGVFRINLIVQTTTEPPLLTTYCSVNGFQWPMAEDAPIIRVCKRSIILGFPGLLYALQFPSVCPDTHIDSLERVFMKFGHYKNFGDTASGGPGYACADNEPGIWSIVRPLAEAKAHEVLVHFGHEPGRLITVLPHMISCYTRATRMSAATKSIVNGHVSGSLRRVHFTVAGTKGGGEGGSSLLSYLMPATPSISVFICLVDAIEAAWMYSMGVPTAVLDLNPHFRSNYRQPGFRVWRLNHMGLTTFVQGLESTCEREEQMVKVRTAIGEVTCAGKGKEASSSEVASSLNAAMANNGADIQPNIRN
ncbi:hypothetical protein QN277_025992 [Acacia crassicarpa]|uniref:Uncharacterized protein n=1 Tax=Acacia crassicarpa TaxID=499986 RepID=A0AAE1J6Z4_9FABA|nr:hypothetical protein QN277_025992 [Acacia crassicarpa]